MNTEDITQCTAEETADSNSAIFQHLGAEDIDKALRDMISVERISNDFKEVKEEKHSSEKSENDEQDFDGLIDNSNKLFLIKILSPEITRNEDKKRSHKDELIDLVTVFLKSQFRIVSILMLGTISAIMLFHMFKNPMDVLIIETIFKYIALYITSVVIELITMLKFIVENVFDTSITTLVELYKDRKTDEVKDDSEKEKNKASR